MDTLVTLLQFAVIAVGLGWLCALLATPRKRALDVVWGVFCGSLCLLMVKTTFADGLGKVQRVPNRIDFDPFPWHSFAIWILTQMKRWGQIKGEVDYAKVASEVFLATDAAKLMKEVGLAPPATTMKSFAVMGKTFDPAKPDEYLKSFAIKRA